MLPAERTISNQRIAHASNQITMNKCFATIATAKNRKQIPEHSTRPIQTIFYLKFIYETRSIHFKSDIMKTASTLLNSTAWER